MLNENSVSINGLKTRVSKKFPHSEIANILLSEPDEMSVETFISKVGTWLAVLDTTHNNLNERNIKEV